MLETSFVCSLFVRCALSELYVGLEMKLVGLRLGLFVCLFVRCRPKVLSWALSLVLRRR